MIGQAAGLVWQLLDAWNSHDVERIARLCSPDYEGVNVGEAAPQIGVEGMANSLAQYFTAFPDLSFSVGDTVAEHDQVAFSWTARGTHQGRVMNIPPTGRRVEVRGVSMLRLENGRIRRGLHVWDVAGLLREIGLLPDL